MVAINHGIYRGLNGLDQSYFRSWPCIHVYIYTTVICFWACSITVDTCNVVCENYCSIVPYMYGRGWEGLKLLIFVSISIHTEDKCWPIPANKLVCMGVAKLPPAIGEKNDWVFCISICPIICSFFHMEVNMHIQIICTVMFIGGVGWGVLGIQKAYFCIL